MKNPVPIQSWNFWPTNSELDSWLLSMDCPHSGNNVDACTSIGYKRTRLELLSAPALVWMQWFAAGRKCTATRRLSIVAWSLVITIRPFLPLKAPLLQALVVS